MAVLESATSSTGSSDEQLVHAKLDELLSASRPQGDVVEFLGAQFDAGLAWVHFPEGEGGWAQPQGQKLVMERIAAAGGPSPYYRNPIGYGMGRPTVVGPRERGAEGSATSGPSSPVRRSGASCSASRGGSDVASLSSRAVRDGDEWVVNGQKVWTTLAHISRWGMLVARTDPEQPKHKGLTYFVVDMHAPGVEVRPLRQITGDAEFNEVYFTDVRIPDAERLGEVGDGWRVSITTLMNERVSIGGAIAPKGSGPIGEAVRLWKERTPDPDGAVEAARKDELMRLWIRAEANRLTNLRASQNRRLGTPAPRAPPASSPSPRRTCGSTSSAWSSRRVGHALRQLRDERAPLGDGVAQPPAGVPPLPGQLDRGRHLRDHAQHPRRAGPRPPRRRAHRQGAPLDGGPPLLILRA
jgi:alkylation response protein AidB-like acyl-CoA dehydrogenase